MIQGNIHSFPGSALPDLFLEKTLFFPVTEGVMMERSDIGPRTYLLNRSKIGFMTAIGDGLVEL